MDPDNMDALSDQQINPSESVDIVYDNDQGSDGWNEVGDYDPRRQDEQIDSNW
jgi:hypothetical protein